MPHKLVFSTLVLVMGQLLFQLSGILCNFAAQSGHLVSLYILCDVIMNSLGFQVERTFLLHLVYYWCLFEDYWKALKATTSGLTFFFILANTYLGFFTFSAQVYVFCTLSPLVHDFCPLLFIEITTKFFRLSHSKFVHMYKTIA